jgi:dimethylhistidine N-methyltransferase
MVELCVTDRLDGFATEVRDGLLASPKRLACRYLYDEEGSRLFDEICGLGEYYLTRAEDEILRERANEIAARMPGEVALVELGCGSARKTTRLVGALLSPRKSLRYLPIDVSRAALIDACTRVTRPNLEVIPLLADYRSGLRQARTLERDRALLLAWLGSSIGNFERADAANFLGSVREEMRPCERFLVGIDLRKDARVLEAAYDDRRGVTARFNLNVLLRINRELGGHFDVRRFRHRARWSASAGCVSLSLVSKAMQRVPIDALGLEIDFSEGEAIHTENTHKYSPHEIDALAAAAGLSVEERWLDREERFSLNLFAPAAG